MGGRALLVVVAAAVRIQEHLKVVLVVHRAVLLLDRAPDLRLHELRGHVERVIIVHHLDARALEVGVRLALWALDVHEHVRPGRVLPVVLGHTGGA